MAPMVFDEAGRLDAAAAGPLKIVATAGRPMVKGDDVSLSDLVPALKPELDLVKATKEPSTTTRTCPPVLLICGTEIAPPFKRHPRRPRERAAAGDSCGCPSDPRCRPRPAGMPAVAADQLWQFFGTDTTQHR